MNLTLTLTLTPLKKTNVDAALKNLVRSTPLDDSSSMNTTDEYDRDAHHSSLSLSNKGIEEHLVVKEDCVNHVKTLKSRHSGFDTVRDQSSGRHQNNEEQ